MVEERVVFESLGMDDRVIYDAGLPRNATVSFIILGHSWHWPPANSTELLVLKDITYSLPYTPSGEQDSVHWLLLLRAASPSTLHGNTFVMLRHRSLGGI